MKTKMMKGKRNSGFSLVELIVVVLIMAIIAVALAPQVMKWVENSRNATDVQTKNELLRVCSLALANNDSFASVKDGGYTIEMKKNSSGSAVTYTYTGGLDATGKPDMNNPYWARLFEVSGVSSVAEFEKKSTIVSEPSGTDPITIKIFIYEDGSTYAEMSGIENKDLDIS